MTSTTSNSSTSVRFIGGTNATQAPQIDYTIHVLLPLLRQLFGCRLVELNVVKRGWFPRGGGVVEMKSVDKGRKEFLDPIVLDDFGDIVSIKG